MLKFINVNKSFLDQVALEDISFEVGAGELVLITGKSGSGKTTLLKLLTKEYDLDSGEIYFQDQAIHNLKSHLIPYHRRKIGAIFQDYKLLAEMNIWENIALALSILGKDEKQIEERVTDLLNLVELPDKAYLFPHQLSGGEAQRIAIARALAMAPELIFADEPTGNLDASNSQNIAKLLAKINKLGTTVLVTSHDPVVIETLGKSRRLDLEDGKLVKDSASKKKASPEQSRRVKIKKSEPKKQDDKKPEPDQTDKAQKPGIFNKFFKKKS